MDRFLNIDWTPPLEDLIDNDFINEGRLEKESVMHRIIIGNFTDPFKNIEEDYKDIKVDLKKGIILNVTEKNDDTEIEKEKEEYKPKQTKEDRPYVPGIVKQIFKFPKKSALNREEHAMCLRILLRFSDSEKPKLTQVDREELQKYMELKQIITKEQDEFLEFAKHKWHERTFKVSREKYINLCWKSKLQYVYRLPRYYSEVTSIPFITDKNIELKFISSCLQIGKIPTITLPTFTKPYMLKIDSKQLETKFPPKRNVSNESSVPFKLPVSEDINCQRLAEDNNVDLVISSSGLNCLVNNIGPKYTNSWIVPIVIKRHNDKNVIYIDKPAPPTANTILEKNTWVYKYVLRYSLIHSNVTSKSLEQPKDDTFGDINSEELLKLEEHENTWTQISKESSSMLSKQNKNTEEILKYQNVKKDMNSLKNASNYKGDSHIGSNFHSASTSSQGQGNENLAKAADNVSYKLFTIGPRLSEQNDLMKNVIKEYRILVRTKTDGTEILQNTVQRLLLLVPKLEHQVDFGAEAITLEEGLKQWISLIFRPHTFLARARISANTSEMLQVEYRTAVSISNEIKRLYNIKVDDSLIVLHNIIQHLSNLPAERYIMRHTPRNGTFAAVLKVAESPGKNVFDLHTVYTEKYQTLPNSSWIPLDKTIVTPMYKCFERMPAMFHPSNSKAFSQTEKCTQKKVQKRKKTGVVRRSLRNKKKN